MAHKKFVCAPLSCWEKRAAVPLFYREVARRKRQRKISFHVLFSIVLRSEQKEADLNEKHRSFFPFVAISLISKVLEFLMAGLKVNKHCLCQVKIKANSAFFFRARDACVYDRKNLMFTKIGRAAQKFLLLKDVCFCRISAIEQR